MHVIGVFGGVTRDIAGVMGVVALGDGVSSILRSVFLFFFNHTSTDSEAGRCGVTLLRALRHSPSTLAAVPVGTAGPLTAAHA